MESTYRRPSPASTRGPGGATGRVERDSLTVRFSEMMHQSDFEDAVYVLMR